MDLQPEVDLLRCARKLRKARGELTDETGAPQAFLTRGAQARLARLGALTVLVTISHDKGMAMAVARGGLAGQIVNLIPGVKRDNQPMKSANNGGGASVE